MNTENMGFEELKEYVKSLIDRLNVGQLREFITWYNENVPKEGSE